MNFVFVFTFFEKNCEHGLISTVPNFVCCFWFWFWGVNWFGLNHNMNTQAKRGFQSVPPTRVMIFSLNLWMCLADTIYRWQYQSVKRFPLLFDFENTIKFLHLSQNSFVSLAGFFDLASTPHINMLFNLLNWNPIRECMIGIGLLSIFFSFSQN